MSRHAITVERRGPSRAQIFQAAAEQQAGRDRAAAESAELERMAREQAKRVLNPPGPLEQVLARLTALEADVHDLRAELADLRGSR